jgi:hypothetical protein
LNSYDFVVFPIHSRLVPMPTCGVTEASPNPKAPLPPVLQEAIDKFERWVANYLQAEQDQSTVEGTLYHYTDGCGLRGILESGQIWFTDYRHLNDPSELVHGIDMAHDVARMIATGTDGHVQLFLQTILDMFRHENFSNSLDFFIASFSRDGDDLGQWRAYADNGRGFAIGLSPSLFKIVTQAPADKPPEFVAPVRYQIDEVCNRHHMPLEEAAAIFLDTVNANPDLVQDKAIGIPFMQHFAREIIASPLIWNCLTSKHPAYKHEKEVRLVIMGTPTKLSPFVKTRLRGSEIVPYIAQPMALREPHKIAQIVIGPSAPKDTERSIRTMLRSFGLDPSIEISASDIPYRAL